MKLELTEDQSNKIREKFERILGRSDFEVSQSVFAPTHVGNIEYTFSAVIAEIPEYQPEDPDDVYISGEPEVRCDLVCTLTYKDWIETENVTERIVKDILEKCEHEDDVFDMCCLLIERFAMLNAVCNVDLTSAPNVELRLRRKYAALFADRSKELSNQVITYLIPCVPEMPQYLWFTLYSFDME